VPRLSSNGSGLVTMTLVGCTPVGLASLSIGHTRCTGPMLLGRKKRIFFEKELP